MKRGAVLTLIVVALALGGMVYAFLNSASPYVTVAEARQSKSTSLHVAGELLKPTLVPRLQEGLMEFDLLDEAGEKLHVVYSGPPPSNLGAVSKVVAIGKMEGDTLRAHRLLIKCPTRYEAKPSS